MTTQQDIVDVERLRAALEQIAKGMPQMLNDGTEMHVPLAASASRHIARTALTLPITQRDEQGDRLREALRDIMDHFGWQDRGPGHSHTVAGLWDDDVSNGDRAGTTCEWCAKWENARRLSIEQGDQDGGEG